MRDVNTLCCVIYNISVVQKLNINGIELLFTHYKAQGRVSICYEYILDIYFFYSLKFNL